MSGTARAFFYAAAITTLAALLLGDIGTPETLLVVGLWIGFVLAWRFGRSAGDARPPAH